MEATLIDAVLSANLELPKMGLVLFTWGNVSAIDRAAGEVAIKPSGVPYEHLRREQIVVTDLDGNVLSGSLRPSSDLMTHLALYRAFPDCNSVVHTHSRMATAWAQAGLSVPALGTTHADYFHGPIPCARKLTEAEIESGYEENTGKVIIETFQKHGIDPVAVPGVLVHSHGPFAWGKDAAQSVYHAAVLEEVCAMAYYTRMIHPAAPEADSYLLDKHYLRKHGKNAYYGQK